MTQKTFDKIRTAFFMGDLFFLGFLFGNVIVSNIHYNNKVDIINERLELMNEQLKEVNQMYDTTNFDLHTLDSLNENMKLKLNN